MPRRPRFNTSNVPQYITQLGINRQPCFFTEDDYDFYLDCLYDAADRWQCEIHAYALLPNHIHILLTPRIENGISKCMQSVNRRYVQYINSTQNRKGTIWAGRYTASLVDETYLLACYRFIEQRPVVAKLVGKPSMYKWSSFNAHTNGIFNEQLMNHDKYESLGRTIAEIKTAYAEYFNNKHVDELTEMIRKAIRYGYAIGPVQSNENIGLSLSEDIKPKKRGRPKKKQNDVLEYVN